MYLKEIVWQGRQMDSPSSAQGNVWSCY